MVLKNDYNKVIIQLTNDEFIYKSFFIRVKIKKADIRSVFYDDGYLGILAYSGRIYSLSLGPLLWSERNKLEDLRKELNKENILFDYTISRAMGKIFPYYMFFLPIFNDEKYLKFKIVLFLIFIIGIIYIKRVSIFSNTVFNIDKDELEIINRKNSIKYKRHEINKIESKKYYDGVTTIEFKKSGNKYSISFKDTPYLIKIYDLSLIKLFG
ncbi:MAG: hypothetical protein E6300_05375 [Clostridium sp.]|uniref:hypothetical protein n=1 Tax=Clostridium sp. TaxID=1506 RepID=UPI001ECC28F2|nr:hypothetical protein [Clostridium sp.]MBS5884210.1 hypothetical protein [Clostridium sp.]MDU7147900.1 hypothetical protein [Clostridium sp.]